MDDIGTSVTVRHAAALCACLPCGSMALAKIDPKSSWTNSDWMLLGILNSLREEPIDPFGEETTKPKKNFTAPVSRMEELLNMPREEVSNGI